MTPDPDPLRKLPKPFDPRSLKWRWHLWTRVRDAEGQRVLHVFWRRIAVMLLVLLVGGWLAAAGAAWWFIRTKQRFPDVSYLNIALPFRWDRHRESLAQYYFQQAREAHAAGRIMESVRLYGAGLARRPDDITARRELAEIHARSRQPQAALKILRAGVESALEDPAYMRLTFECLFELQRDAEAQELAERLLPRVSAGTPVERFLALQAAQAALNRGDFDTIDHLSATRHFEQLPHGQVLLARADWERGYPELALVRLEQARHTFPRHDGIALTLVRYQRDLGRLDQALNGTLMRHANNPASPEPRIDLLRTWHARRDDVRYQREVASYLRDFTRDPRALFQLLWFTAEAGDAALAGQVRDLLVAADARLPASRLSLSVAQAWLTAGRPREALEELKQGAAATPGDQSTSLALLDGLNALAHFQLGDSGAAEFALQSFLTRGQPRTPDVLELGRKLEELKRPDHAHRLHLAAVAAAPDNQNALTAVVRTAATLNDPVALLRFVPRLLTKRKASHPVLAAAYAALDPTVPEQAVIRDAITAALGPLPAPPLG